MNITLDGTILETVSSTKFLGLTIDNKLSWKPHIDSVCRTISRNIHVGVTVINNVTHYFPTSTLLFSYIHPFFLL